MKWPLVKLGDCGAIISGATPKTAISDYWDGDILWATPKDLSNLQGTYISDTANKITAEGFKSCSATMLPADSVLFSSRAPIGLLAINTQPMCTNQGFKSIVPIKEKINSKYLYYILKSKKRYLNSIGNGATFKELSKEVFSKVEIPLPPLDDQIRIATVLTRAEQLIAKRKDSIQALDELLKSTFLEMFGDPVRNEKGWQEIPIMALSLKITDGEHLNPDFVSDGMPMVMAGNVLENTVDIANTKKVSLVKGESYRKKCGPEKGDVLLVSRGATIGRLCRNDQAEPFCLMGSVILIKPNRELVNSAFLTQLLKHPRMHKKLFNSSGSSAQQAIYLKDVKKLVCIHPALQLQNQFAAIVEKVEALKEKYQQSLAELENLYGSLSQRAFKGELDLSGVRV